MEKKYTLPKEFGEKWLIALRSGKYKQSIRNLLNDGGYCCLGVGCSINGVKDEDIYGKHYPDNNSMPNEIFQRQNGKPTLEYVLSVMNDKGDFSFEEIADWIEENVELT